MPAEKFTPLLRQDTTLAVGILCILVGTTLLLRGILQSNMLIATGLAIISQYFRLEGKRKAASTHWKPFWGLDWLFLRSSLLNPLEWRKTPSTVHAVFPLWEDWQDKSLASHNNQESTTPMSKEPLIENQRKPFIVHLCGAAFFLILASVIWIIPLIGPFLSGMCLLLAINAFFGFR